MVVLVYNDNIWKVEAGKFSPNLLVSEPCKYIYMYIHTYIHGIYTPRHIYPTYINVDAGDRNAGPCTFD